MRLSIPAGIFVVRAVLHREPEYGGGIVTTIGPLLGDTSVTGASIDVSQLAIANNSAMAFRASGGGLAARIGGYTVVSPNINLSSVAADGNTAGWLCSRASLGSLAGR